MKQKIASLLLVFALIAFHSPLAIAEIDATAPTTDTTTAAEPVSEPVEEPVPDPEPDPTPVVEEIITPTDTAGPSFISVATVSAGETESSIVWTTDEMSTGHIEYGQTTSYGQTTGDTPLALEHSQTISGLTAGTVYHYRIVATDEPGNTSYSQDRTLETSVELVAADNVPPEIQNIIISNITTSGATIGWDTDELAQGKVEYGLTENYGSQTPVAADYATNHSANIGNLSAGTVYHYRVVVADEAGNTFSSPDEMFTTDDASSIEPTPEPTPTATTTDSTNTTSTTTNGSSGGGSTPSPAFAISEVETASVSTATATIIWTTNEAATTQVFYGKTESHLQSSPLISSSETSHTVKLTSLTPGTVYFYKVVSTNSRGQTVTKSGYEFTTLFKQVIVDPAPVISNVQVESVGTSTVSIIWNTNEGAAGELYYGATTAYGYTDNGHTNLLTAHRHVLSGLTPNTTYNFQPVVWDTAGNESVYENMTFRTAAASSNVSTPANSTVNPPAVSSPAPRSSRGGGRRRFTTGSSGVTNVSPLDSQALFLWNAVPETSKVKTVIVKKAGHHPATPFDGTTVYKGTSGRFTDTGLSNDNTYYYSVFRVDQLGNYSKPTEYTVVPKSGITQTAIDIVPAVVQRTPIYTFDQALTPGDTSKKISHLQVLLASEPKIYPEGLVTGYYGQLTSSALVRFQTKYKLPQTGIADRATLDKLQKVSTIEHVTPFKKLHDYWDRDLVLGMSGQDVSLLQSHLAKLGYYPEGLVTGFFGPLTQNAVITFQKAQAIVPAVGYFGPISQQRITNLIKLQGTRF
ncbi:MAG: peptidoglycan-binding protein [Patescibacteria group bacterium]